MADDRDRIGHRPSAIETHEQIAEFLGLPLGTTKSRIRAGLHALRAHLSPLFAAGLLVLGLVSVFHFRERSRLYCEVETKSIILGSASAPLRFIEVPRSHEPGMTSLSFQLLTERAIQQGPARCIKSWGGELSIIWGPPTPGWPRIALGPSSRLHGSRNHRPMTDEEHRI